MKWHKFVAVGDSFTEGLDDPRPDGHGFRGWADLVAERLAAEYLAAQRAPLAQGSSSQPVPGQLAADGFLYANLAIRGRRFDRVVEEQVPAALGMSPDLISFSAGGNDVLLRKLEMAEMLARFEQVILTMRASLADVIIFTLPDVTSRLPRRERILPRLQMLNDETVRIGTKYDTIIVDLWPDDEFRNPRLWSQDRLHLAPAGHERVAAHALSALGLTPEPSWLAPPMPPEDRSWYAARVADLHWVRTYYWPWLKRRLTGRSTGDLITAKRPALAPVIEAAASLTPPLAAAADAAAHTP